MQACAAASLGFAKSIFASERARHPCRGPAHRGRCPVGCSIRLRSGGDPVNRPTPDDALPPLTNRGVVRPEDDRLGGGVDYLKLTVWADPEEVKDLLGLGVLDRYGWNTDPYDNRDDWIELTASARAKCVHDSGSIQIVEYDESVLYRDMFCSVEAKGEACAHLGNEGIKLLLDDLNARFRVRASRVDVMAHTEAFTPRTIRDAVLAGDVCSRSVDSEKMVFIESAAGDTCYLGMGSKPKGGLKRLGERVLRFYDRRGPVRVELQMSGVYGHGAGDHLLSIPIDEWPVFIRGCIRHYCDFVDRQADKRATRCPILPWWSAFVDKVEKISVRPITDPLEGTPIGMLDGIYQRYHKRLYAGLVAYGPAWVISRIEWHGKRKLSEEHNMLVEELKRYLGSGLARVPERDEETPPF